MHEQSLDEASDRFLEACLGMISWSDALDDFSRASGSVGVNLMPIRAQIPGTIRETGSIEGLVDFYFEHEIYKNCIRARGIPVLEKRGIMVDKDCATEMEVRSDPYYQEFLRPFGLLWGGYVGLNIGQDLWACLLHRGLDQEPFSTQEQTSLLRLRSQLTLAASVGQKLADTRFESMSDALDMADIACLFFNRAGKITRVNVKAERLLRNEVNLINGELYARHSKDGTVLRKLVQRVLFGEIVNDGKMSFATLDRLGKRPLIVHVQRLKGKVQDLFPATTAIGFLVDPDEQRPLGTTQLLQSLFGMTASEAKLAMELAHGRELADIADEFGIAYETARSQLKRVFSKADVGRQGELIALINRLTI